MPDPCTHASTYTFTGDGAGGSYTIEWCRACGALRTERWDEHTRQKVWDGWDVPSGAAAEQPWKFGIMHPSERAFGHSLSGREGWGAETPLLFETREEAQARIAVRSKQYPNSDWSQARVLRCKPGKPRVHPQWEWKEVEGGK